LKKIIISLILIVFFIVLFFISNMPRHIANNLLFQKEVQKYAKLNKVDPLFVNAVIAVESKFIYSAHSKNGAVGLMQLMPETAQELSDELGEKSLYKDLENPKTNIRLGVYYLKKLLTMFDGNKTLALAAYNAGSGNVSNWLKKDESIKTNIKNIPFAETKNYVSKVLRTYNLFKRIEKWITNLITKHP